MRRPATAPVPSLFVRACIGIWLAVHVFVIAAAPVADALTEHATAIVSHWEDAQDTSCPPQHDPDVCRLCQVVSATFGGGVTPRLAPARLAMAVVPPPSHEGLGAYPLALRGSPHPRGPPLV